MYNINLKRITSVSTIIFIVMMVLMLLNYQSHLLSQTDASNFRALLEKYKDEMDLNEGFVIAIRLKTPIIPGEEVIIVPDKNESAEDEFSRVISEIGDDYICFDSLGGSARLIECVPFSNIASIRHFV